MKNDTSAVTVRPLPPLPPPHVQTHPRSGNTGLRTHAVKYAEKPWLHMHIPHYGLTVSSQYLNKANTDGQMEEGDGTEAR